MCLTVTLLVLLTFQSFAKMIHKTKYLSLFFLVCWFYQLLKGRWFPTVTASPLVRVVFLHECLNSSL